MIETIHHDERIPFTRFLRAMGDLALYGFNDSVAGLLAQIDNNLFDFGGED